MRGRAADVLQMSASACGRGEMVDARDLKSLGRKLLCRLKSGRPHHHQNVVLFSFVFFS